MREKKAFTIIELMLAMAFLGTMMMGIASLIIQITNIYQKGLSVRAVNTVGREIISDLTRTVTASRVGDLTINPNADDNNNIPMENVLSARSKYFVEQKEGNTRAGKQLSGAFCTGSYSYVWNTAEGLRAARNFFKTTGGSGEIELSKGRLVNANRLSQFLNGAGSNTIVVKTIDSVNNNVLYLIPKFIRFQDENRDACLSEEVGTNTGLYSMRGNVAGTIKNGKKTLVDLAVTNVQEKDITELIAENEADLALYDFSILPATQNYTTSQIFYSGTFILATYRGGVNIKSNGDFCQGSDNANVGLDSESEYTGNDLDYCAVNKFNFAVRATGEASIQEHGGN